MKPAYEPDNTRSSIVILASLAIIVGVVTALIGLSDKPEVSTIAIAPVNDVGITQTSPNFGFETDAGAASDREGEAGDSGLTSTLDTSSEPGAEDGAAGEAADTEPTRDVIPVPTLAPTPTAEVAAAVEPTSAPEDGSAEEAAGAVQPAPSLPTSAGSVQGTFFTKGDENEGAQVAQNLITVSFAEDGSGEFQGVLDITYADDTHILLNMSGPLEFAAASPQVETKVLGKFTLDAPIDADDLTSDDAELVITSLSAGSGSLCTTKCFGFTFPPPVG